MFKVCSKFYPQVFTIQFRTVTYRLRISTKNAEACKGTSVFLVEESQPWQTYDWFQQRQPPILHPVIFDANELYFDRTWRLRRSRQCSLFSKCPTNQQQQRPTPDACATSTTKFDLCCPPFSPRLAPQVVWMST